MVTRPRADGRRVFLALSSALLLVLAQPPFQFILLPFLSLVPLAAALRLPRGSRVEAPALFGVWIGLFFGLLHWGVQLAWVPFSVGRHFAWAFPGYLAQVVLLSALTALMGWATGYLQRRPGVPLFLAFPLAWVGMEFLKAHFPFGLAFPWLGLGITLTAWPELLGVAEWVGEGGVALWLATVNGLLAWSLGRGLRGVSVAALIAFLPALLGLYRARTLPLEPGPRVLVVGTGVEASLRLEPEAGSLRALAEVRALLASTPPGTADLVVLPEALVGVPLGLPEGGELLDSLVALAQGLQTPLLFGALGGAGDALPTNSVFLMASDGRFRGRYDKTRLVPGMEWQGYRSGDPSGPLSIAGIAPGPLICYESLFGSLARRYGQEGGTVLVNLTSDVWFGEAGTWLGRIFLPQHPAHLVMRAAENRMGVARSANGGYSLLLDPLGRPLTPPVPPGPGLILARVPVFAGMTLYTRTGDLVGPLTLVTLLALLLAGNGARFPRVPGSGPAGDPGGLN